MRSCCITQEAQPVLCDDLGGQGREEVGRLMGEYVDDIIMADSRCVWQKPTHPCKNLKKKNNIEKKTGLLMGYLDCFLV